MSSIKNDVRYGQCTNVARCPVAVAGEALCWYLGAGEYCPECGEVLAPTEPGHETPQPALAAPTFPSPGRAAAPIASPSAERGGTHSSAQQRGSAARIESADFQQNAARLWSRLRVTTPPRLLWIITAASVVSAAFIYYANAEAHRLVTSSVPARIVSVCLTPSARRLAADLVHEYTMRSAIPADRFVFTNAAACDVRFSTSPDTPEHVIARDGIVAVVNPRNTISRISEKELRDIFKGEIRNWSQLGMPPGAIVPIMPDAGSDEVEALSSSLFSGVAIGHAVRHGGSSAEVARAVAGTDQTSRNAIGLVSFSQAVTAKVLPLTHFPPPSVLSIASRGYPYTLTIAMQASRDADAVARFMGFARSTDGATIVLKNGLIPRQGL